MSCCCPQASSAARFFSRFAGRYRRRFERRGFERSQLQLMAGLAAAGYGDATVLEIGCGVGHLHQTLLERGARAATGVELAPAMLAEARRWAAERGLAARTDYREGDFIALAAALDVAEVTVLDKVVCCYPDAAGLVDASLARTGRVYALTIPRDRWFTRLGVAVIAVGMRVLGSAFRPYVHSPQEIDARIRGQGLERVWQDHTVAWLTRVYARPAGAAGG